VENSYRAVFQPILIVNNASNAIRNAPLATHDRNMTAAKEILLEAASVLSFQKVLSGTNERREKISGSIRTCIPIIVEAASRSFAILCESVSTIRLITAPLNVRKLLDIPRYKAILLNNLIAGKYFIQK
jgi:hypothetical protein